ncbi:MAG TPA: collagen-binding domain-containing protein, partial [Candidatus Binatia bacterium]|nr:collagen-binding domain-containing protein [Candidatus Binatia bacterium]
AAAGLPNSSGSSVNRKIQVRTVYSALFPGAITTVTNIDLNGNNVRVDSFDSTMTNASAWNSLLGYGTYDITKARANGNVATDSSLVGAITVGQANIYGHVQTGPGGTSTVGHNGYVGPLPQSGSGIQPGYSSDDMNVVFAPVSLPGGASSWQGVPASQVITNSGNYYMFSINNNLTINASNVTLYVYNSISLSGQSAITIGTNASRVTMYVGGPSFSLSGNATINNLTQNATVFGIYGLPSLTSINFGGNAGFTGTIYAPQASFQFGGGGNNTYDFVGALVAYSCKLNGHANFHYDESLKRNGPGIGYIPYTWTEITGN